VREDKVNVKSPIC